MNLQYRLQLLTRLGEYLLADDDGWRETKEKAQNENPWFIREFIDFQVDHIGHEYLSPEKLQKWVEAYDVPLEIKEPKNVGIVMAGNIPLAGFHDFLSAFVSGHRQTIKPSSKDFQLIKGVTEKLIDWDPAVKEIISMAEQLKGCDAYIATGSNNSSRYFEYYFSKYPHIIRRNRTSVAILTGNETLEDLAGLADDVYLYFGLGCRNVTKIFVPEHYDFLPLLDTFKKYNWVFDMHKYKNNYDYQLAVMIINKIYYMTNGSILLQENRNLFSPISQLNFEYCTNPEEKKAAMAEHADVQCVVSKTQVPFGRAQKPGLSDYADKADTLKFLLEI